MEKIYRCKICNKEFIGRSKYGGHLVSIHHVGVRKFPRIKVNKACPKCGLVFEVERKVNGTENNPQRGEPKYCSRKCANGHEQSEEQNQARREKLSGENSPTYIDGRSKVRYCSCGRIISGNNKHDKCRWCLLKDPQYRQKLSSNISKSGKGKSGGLRHGSGRGKKGWYNGYWCDSTWELAYVIYCLDHDISILRNSQGFEYTFEGKSHKYYPDFILEDGLYLEIKGYMTEQNKEKIRQFRGRLEIIGKNEIKPYLDYVIEKYGKEFVDLYE